ncbi:hypothetical protein H7X46_21540 [Pseudonocardia sp. C8]|nr:hypothetical protein [Pseudonocardia sp. C8]
MRTPIRAAALSITVLGLTLAGATAAVAAPVDGVGPCSAECTVGGLGQGGTSSDGAAQGSFRAGPGRIPEVNATAAGTEESGRLELSGAIEGTLSGTFHRGGGFRGHTTGSEFGECSGQCAP